ncbi:MAG: DUF5643 domain-containing protein, partial [Peptostreptococcaceae bacterium]
EGDIKRKFKIDEVRISPVSVKIKVDVDGYTPDGMYLTVRDENGNGLDGSGRGSSDGNGMYYDFELKGTEKKITIIPVINLMDNPKSLENEKIEIEIPQNQTSLKI